MANKSKLATMLKEMSAEYLADVENTIKAAYIADKVNKVFEGADNLKASKVYAFLNGSIAQVDNADWFTQTSSWLELIEDWEDVDESINEVLRVLES